jgi:hypothetical protein
MALAAVLFVCPLLAEKGSVGFIFVRRKPYHTKTQIKKLKFRGVVR